MEPTDPVKLVAYLERLLAGLEQTCESQRIEIPYYKPDDIQGVYAKKFLAAMEEQAAVTRKRLEELRNTLPPTQRIAGE